MPDFLSVATLPHAAWVGSAVRADLGELAGCVVDVVKENGYAMKHHDFEIGMMFYTSTGQRWRCTDVGSRTILAIELKPNLDESWFNGPPYAVIEVPFDEYDMGGAYRDESEAIQDALEEADRSAHPGFPHDVVKVMSKAGFTDDSRAYPRKELLRIERVDETGEILHPYGVECDGDGWYVLVYVLFAETFLRITETDFVRLRHATEEDMRKRWDRKLTG